MGKKILLADDSITIQKVIELTFSDEDFEVVTVGNGRLAVERVLDVRPDIVLCDIIMPEKDGYEVCDFIKRSPQLSNVPVLLLTGAFEPFDQERAARVACDGFLAKPFEPETLIAKVKDLLQKAAARSSSSVTGPRMAVQVPVPAPPPPPPSAPPRPVEPPAPALVSFAPASREPLPFTPAPPPPREPLPFPSASPPPAPAAEEVRFIPDEPFDDLESAGFGPAPTPSVPHAAAPGAEPTVPPMPMEPEAYAVTDELETEPEELVQMTPEESQSLAPPPVEDSSSTVVFRPAAVPWTQQPTMEVPLEARAQASIESAQGGPLPASEEATVFEEVLEEEVESLVGPEPEPEPSLSSTMALGASTAEPPPPPLVVEPQRLAVPEPQPALEPAAVAAPPPEPVVPALESVTPVAPAVVAAAPPVPEGPEESIESFVGAPPEPEPRAAAPSVSGEVAVPNDMVAQIAQRVVAQISEKVVRQIAWEVIPDLAEGLIKKEIERLKAELQET